MYLLTQMKIKKDGLVEKGTSVYDTEKEAIIQFHVAMSSAMSKEETEKFGCVIMDDNLKAIKREIYEVPNELVDVE